MCRGRGKDCWIPGQQDALMVGEVAVGSVPYEVILSNVSLNKNTDAVLASEAKHDLPYPAFQRGDFHMKSLSSSK